MQMQKSYKIRLHVISPIHLGCDDVYEPTGFVVDKAQKKLISFDPVDFVRSLNPADRKRFLELCDKGTLASVVELYKFMGTVTTSAEGHSVQVTQGLLSIYERVSKMNPRDERHIKQELNNLLIARTSYLPADNAPYIPGTAVKGALRTGWLNHLNKGQRADLRSLESNLLGGSFAGDPFSQVKVGDLLPVGRPATKVCFAVNKKKRPSPHEPRGPQQILEVIRHDCGAVFEGIITIHTPQPGSPITRPIKGSLEFFAHASYFFSREMAHEETALKAINLPASIAVKMKKAFGERYLQTVFPIRLGRHSGAEAVTVEGVRNIKIMGRKGDPPKYAPHSTTLWLAGDAHKATSNLLPFGWAAFELLEPDPTAPLYPERKIIPKAVSLSATAVVDVPKKPTITAAQIVWESATLAWNPGSQTLAAVSTDGNRAEIMVGADRNLVSDEIITRLKKGKTVKAGVTVFKEGNLLKIVALHLLAQ